MMSEPASILIVDDEAYVRTSVGRALELSGYAVQMAADGEEALQRLAAAACDLMLLDLRLPGMSGTAVMRTASQLYPELLIIVLTGYADEESAIAAVQSGAVDYLCKPISVHQVVATVDLTLRARADRLRRRDLMRALAQTMEALAALPLDRLTEAARPRDNSTLRAGPLVLDVRRRQVRAAGRTEDRAAELSEEETGVLAALMAQPGRIISARVLARGVRGQEMTELEAEQMLRPLVFELCRKLAAHSGRPDAIRGARRAGYFLAVD